MSELDEYTQYTPLISSLAIIYPTIVKVYIPNLPFRRLPKEMDPSFTDEHKSKRGEIAEDDLERSLRRTHTKVRDYIVCNNFEIFATFTFNPEKTDRYDTVLCKQKMSIWLKNQRVRNGKFKYLIVSEFHHDGALHFHALLKNYSGKLVYSKLKNGTTKYDHGKPVYQFKSYKLGLNEAQYIGQDPEEQIKLGSYMLKYLTKDMPILFGKKRFWISQGLLMPLKEDNPQWYKGLKPDRIHKNDFGKIYEYFRPDLNTELPDYIRRLASGSSQMTNEDMSAMIKYFKTLIEIERRLQITV